MLRGVRVSIRVHSRAAGHIVGLLVAIATAQGLWAGDAPWWVSLGVYRGEAAAQRALEALPADAAPAGSQPRIIRIEKDGTTYHRVVAGPYATRATIDNALPAWRVQVQGAFPLLLEVQEVAASAELAAAMPVQTETEAPASEAASEATASEAAPVALTSAESTVLTSESTHLAPVASLSPVGSRALDAPPAPAARSARSALDTDGLETATERLLRDDRALQRELERLSRGLPKGLSAEIDAARAEGVSLRELKMRAPAAPQSPTEAPADYQLNRLRRDPSPTDVLRDDAAHAAPESDWWRFLQCTT